MQTPSRGLCFEHVQNKRCRIWRSRRLLASLLRFHSVAGDCTARTWVNFNFLTLWKRCEDAALVWQGFYYTCCKSCLTLNILTTNKYYDKFLRKVKIDHYVRKIWLLKIWNIVKKILNAMISAITLYAPCNRHGRYKDAVGSSIGTLWGRCVHAIPGKFDIFRRISRRPHMQRADRFTERVHIYTKAVTSPFGVTGTLLILSTTDQYSIEINWLILYTYNF